jgi:branched-chain amino acid aminotransferase
MSGRRNALYGDGFFETIACHAGRIPLAAFHWSRIIQTAAFLRIELCDELNTFEKFIAICLNAGAGCDDSRIRLDIYRSGGGRYLPETNISTFTIAVTSLSDVFNSKDLRRTNVGIIRNYHLSLNELHRYKLISRNIQVLAALEAKDNQWDEAILLNDRAEIAEAISSNIFFINSRGDLFTPSIGSGALDGVMRSYILSNLSDDYSIFESVITVDDLSTFESCFLTNAIQGIVLVDHISRVHFENKQGERFRMHVLDQLLTKYY